MLIVFDHMIADILHNKKLNQVVSEIFIRGRKINISLVFITQFYFAMPKNVRLSSSQYFIMKIPNKQELQQIGFNYSSDTDFKYFMNLHKNCNAKLYYFLIFDASLASGNPLCFRTSLLERL